MRILQRHERFQDARLVYNIHGKQTMDEVAAATGISKNMISDLENPEKDRDVGCRSITKLADYYGVSIDWLMGLTTDSMISPGEMEDLGISEESKYRILRQLKNNSELRSFSGFINDMVEIGVSPEMRHMYDSLIASARKSAYFGGFCDSARPQTVAEKDIDALGFQMLSPTQAINYYAYEVAELIKRTIIAKYTQGIPVDEISAYLDIRQTLEKLDVETLRRFNEYVGGQNNGECKN